MRRPTFACVFDCRGPVLDRYLGNRVSLYLLRGFVLQSSLVVLAGAAGAVLWIFSDCPRVLMIASRW